jgi:hypothetical protein
MRGMEMMGLDGFDLTPAIDEASRLHSTYEVLGETYRRMWR